MSDSRQLVRALVIWAIAACFFYYENLLQSALSPMRPELTQAFQMSAEQFGILSACWLWAYGLMQLPVGLLVDRFGPRRLLLSACFLVAMGCLWFGYAQTLGEAKMARIVMGIGAGFAWVSALKLVHLWFPENRFALMMGGVVTIGYLGPFTNHILLAYAYELLGWREVMKVGAMVGLLLCLCIIFCVKDRARSKQADQEPTMTFGALLHGLKCAMLAPQVWIASIYAGLMFVPTLAFGTLWGTPFLTEAHGYTRIEAGQIMSWLYVGWIFGAPFFGWFSDRLGRRNVPLYIGTIATLGLSMMIIYGIGLSVGALKIILFGMGFFSSAFLLTFGIVRELHAPILAGTMIGFLNAWNSFFGAIAQQLIGKMLDWRSVGPTVDRVFSVQEYQFALLSMPISLLIAGIIVFFLKETYCKQVVSE